MRERPQERQSPVSDRICAPEFARPAFWLFALYDKNELCDLSKRGSGNAAKSFEDRIEDEEVGMKKRNLMAELTEGLLALADQRTRKRTLRTHVVQTKATLKMSAKELSAPALTRKQPY